MRHFKLKRYIRCSFGENTSFGRKRSGEARVRKHRPLGSVPAAYVMQDDTLFEMATVNETFMFVAQLRMAHGTTAEETGATRDGARGLDVTRDTRQTRRSACLAGAMGAT